MLKFLFQSSLTFSLHIAFSLHITFSFLINQENENKCFEAYETKENTSQDVRCTCSSEASLYKISFSSINNYLFCTFSTVISDSGFTPFTRSKSSFQRNLHLL